MRDFSRHNPIRRGLTLIELLVVIAILMLLAAVAIPAMQPALEGRRIREAARPINVYFGSARGRAMESGRPCGVVIRRFDTLPQCSMVLGQAEVPPPYAGDLTTSVIRVQNWTNVVDPNPNTNRTTPPYWPDARGDANVVLKVQLRVAGDLSNGLVRRGDLIQINHQGPYYVIVDDPWDNDPVGGASPPADAGLDFPVDEHGFIDFVTDVGDNLPAGSPDGWIDTHVLTLRLDPTEAQTVPWPPCPDASDPNVWLVDPSSWSLPLPFEIIRQPVESSATPLQLPTGAVIDLTASGTDRRLHPLATDSSLGWVDGTDLNSIMVIFASNGSIDRLIYHAQVTVDDGPPPVYLYDRVDVHPTEPIYLLVGKSEKIPIEAGRENWRDLTNLWITLNPQTGLVATAEVAPQDPTDGDTTDGPDDSRDFAREARNMGGR